MIRLLTIAPFAVRSFTVGFLWSWLALFGGLVLFFLTLSRMLFGGSARSSER